MAVTGWKRFRRAIRAGVICGFVRASMLLPLRVATAIGAALGLVGWVLSGRLRRDMRASLLVAFPEKSARERDAIARSSLVHLGRVGGELITMRRWAARVDEVVEATPEAIATMPAPA